MKKAVFLAALLVGIVWNLRLAMTDLAARRNSPDGTRLAMRMMPGNGAYAAQLADELYASDPVGAKSLLQKAVRLNRFDAASWIQLGLLCESGNDLPQAEESLLQAARVDSTFLPGWSLANFYFRHEQADPFWNWAQKAAQMAPDDATPLFRLAWYASPNAGEIENRLQIRRPAVEAQFVNFLITQGDPQAVSQATSHLLAAGAADSTEALLGACDWLLAQKRPDLALGLWNGLAGRISYAAPGGGALVTNSSFGRAPTSHGFDWHVMTVDGVSSYWNADPSALGFEFSGEEPDGFTLMTQTVPVQAGKAYALAVDYQSSGIAPGSGLSWAVSDERTGTVLARTASLSSEQGRGQGAEQGGRAYACFTAPDGAAFIRLSLDYQRQPGTVRVEGKLGLKEVRISAGNCPEKKNSPSTAASEGF
jgi:tetratricopeptide (TPR) repeat protein